MTEWDLYWLTRLDGIHELLGITGGVGLVIAGVTAFMASIAIFAHDLDTDCWKHVRRIWIACGVFILLIVASVFVPTTREYAVIKVLPWISQQEITQEVGGLSKELVGLAKEWVQELKPEK